MTKRKTDLIRSRFISLGWVSLRPFGFHSYHLILNWFTPGRAHWLQLTTWLIRKLAGGTSVKKHWIVLFNPSPPCWEVIKWLTRLYSPGSLTEPHQLQYLRQWISLFLPSRELLMDGNTFLHDWIPSVTNGMIFLASSLPLRLKAEHCFGKPSPLNCPLLSPFVSFTLQWTRGPDWKRELKGWIGRKCGVPFVFDRRGLLEGVAVRGF